MKYCYRFNTNLKNIDEADEIKIIYKNQDKELPAFLEKHSDKRITLTVEFLTMGDVKLIKAIAEEYPDIDLAICFGNLQRATSIPAAITDLLQYLAPIKYYFNMTVSSWEMLHYFISLGVSDVYISEQLGFELPAVKALCSSHGVSIRAFPNVAQSETTNTDPLQRFFIRPEDTDIYAQYIDTFEFWGPDDRQAIFRRIYERKEWGGDLQEIITSLNRRLESPRLVPVWGETRVSCKRGCLADKSCRICQRIANVSEQLEKENLFIKQRKHFDFS